MPSTISTDVNVNVLVFFPELGTVRDIPVTISLEDVSDNDIERALTEAVTDSGSVQDEWALMYDRNGVPLYYVNQYR